MKRLLFKEIIETQRNIATKRNVYKALGLLISKIQIGINF